MIPVKDEALVAWATNASDRLTLSPVTYGTTAAVATQFATLRDAFVTAKDAQVAAQAAGTRSEALTALKQAAKVALLEFARPLYKQIQANAGVSDAAKIELGVVVPKVAPTPFPIPSMAPVLRVESVDGGLVRLALRDPNDPDRARLPYGVSGAIVMSYIGPTEPTNPAVFKMEGPTSRMSVDVLFPDTVAPGTKVWFTALFFNPRKEMGPACQAISTVINYGGSMPMAA